MYSGLIGQTSPLIDLNHVLTGQWDERTSNGWHIVMTPFFTTMDAVVSEGSVALPYTVTKPVAGLLFGNSGEVHALVIKPNTTAIVCAEPGVVQIQVFGDASHLKAVR
jgi:hypothetical protein